MILAFLRNRDGDFDFAALLFFAVMLIFSGNMFFVTLPKALRRQKIPFAYRGDRCMVERDKNPKIFWFLFGFYAFGFLVALAFAMLWVFGIIYKW